MEYNGMDWGVVNQHGKYCSYLMMQSMSKLKEEEKIIMPKGINTLKAIDYLRVVHDVW